MTNKENASFLSKKNFLPKHSKIWSRVFCIYQTFRDAKTLNEASILKTNTDFFASLALNLTKRSVRHLSRFCNTTIERDLK